VTSSGEPDRRVGVPQHGALAALAIDQHDRLARAPARHDPHLARVYRLRAQLLDRVVAGRVVAHGADVARVEPEARARHHGGGDLAAALHLQRPQLELLARYGRPRQDAHLVDGALADADHVEVADAGDHGSRSLTFPRPVRRCFFADPEAELPPTPASRSALLPTLPPAPRRG
jgi:hypothetical protein